MVNWYSKAPRKDLPDSSDTSDSSGNFLTGDLRSKMLPLLSHIHILYGTLWISPQLPRPSYAAPVTSKSSVCPLSNFLEGIQYLTYTPDCILSLITISVLQTL
ncbi:hypothetical protein CRENBAI_004123 [Crenichthys baileyi]|uniref:Uncharacterized protein n=1 Tax=Crenichthys baileyi TaxID=28760 RepID=A0AAV9R1E6_9TELE